MGISSQFFFLSIYFLHVRLTLVGTGHGLQIRGRINAQRFDSACFTSFNPRKSESYDINCYGLMGSIISMSFASHYAMCLVSTTFADASLFSALPATRNYLFWPILDYVPEDDDECNVYWTYISLTWLRLRCVTVASDKQNKKW